MLPIELTWARIMKTKLQRSWVWLTILLLVGSAVLAGATLMKRTVSVELERPFTLKIGRETIIDLVQMWINWTLFRRILDDGLLQCLQEGTNFIGLVNPQQMRGNL